MNLKELLAFDALMATGSVTAAAKVMGMTQPGVSRLLNSLEERTEFMLFHRERGRLFPTEEALVLAQEVKLTLGSMDRLNTLMDSIGKYESGQLTIVAPNSFIAGPLADVLTDFMHKYPKIKINLDSQTPEQASKSVALGAADCGFIQLPENHKELDCEPMLSSLATCVVPITHKLSNKTEITCADLLGENLILLGKGRYSREQIDAAFAHNKIKMLVKLETHTVAVACAFAKRNIGIAIVNTLLADQYTGAGLALITFAPKIVHEYGFITANNKPKGRLTNLFYQHCQQSFLVK